MEQVSLETLEVWAGRSGLPVFREDLNRFRPILEQYLERVRALHTLNLAGEPVSAVLHADWRLQKEARW